ncbi:PQQ-dependent sugar dehydrogenase [Parapedobacter lycopersici]|uniref:PQQ-dependent sugar dehydrogenase n=1 Tax=Parapedobacter lycopersici TaxID=1864939 RepID=UPI00333E8FE7
MTNTFKLLGVASTFMVLATSCNSSPSTDGQNAGADSTLAPVETNAPNSDYQPAFAGQTRVGGVKTATDYAVTILSEALESPWGIAALPDGRFLVTEKAGTMRIVAPDGALGEAIGGLPKVNADGQGGLLGVTIDPGFESNRMVYWTFSDNTSNGTVTAVGKGKLSADERTMENVQVIYRASPAYDGRLHYGSRILFDGTGNIILSTGERSDLETRPQAQDLKSGLGKVIRITKDGNPAPGNPFEGRADARPEIYSYGHRNVQGLAIHPETGDLWEAEFGPRGGDEINRIEAGKNYGWPTITYGIEYSGKKIGDSIQQQEGMEQPVYYYDPSISPSGITFYAGNAIPEWQNNLFVASLSGTHIARLVIENNKVVGEERLLADQGQRFRAIIEGVDGALYAITDGGRLYRIGKK